MKRYDVAIIGRAGIDLYSDDLGAPLDQARHFMKYVGGTAANTAIGCAKYGMKVALITKVSKDPLGKFIKDYLAKNGVDASYIKEDPDAFVGVVFAAIFPGKDPDFIFYRPPGYTADTRISKKDIPVNVIRDSKVLEVTGTGLTETPSYEANLYAVEVAKESNTEVLFNLDWRESLWKYVAKQERLRRYESVLEKADIVVGGIPEWLAATGTSNIDDAINYVKKINNNVKIMIITRGNEGVTAFWNGERIDVEAFKVNILKTLGAGDAFLAAFLYGYLYLIPNGWSVRDILRFANAAAAIVVTRHSCSEAMPTFDEVTIFIKNNINK
ncbi:5-dehydro-2-deoxygluconokinase [Desulfurella sp.]|uniref:5-dehydro-2-deoxygluconokinase n=1 Tax=Desulfurella sp. TaxID=1962857 RepID=UPI0025C21EDD|nr:5-dehydro-2-deoxygluconokinase [Desulfurella sp.]